MSLLQPSPPLHLSSLPLPDLSKGSFWTSSRFWSNLRRCEGGWMRRGGAQGSVAAAAAAAAAQHCACCLRCGRSLQSVLLPAFSDRAPCSPPSVSARYFFMGAGDWADALVATLGAHADALRPLASHQLEAALAEAIRVGGAAGQRHVATRFGGFRRCLPTWRAEYCWYSHGACVINTTTLWSTPRLPMCPSQRCPPPSVACPQGTSAESDPLAARLRIRLLPPSASAISAQASPGGWALLLGVSVASAGLCGGRRACGDARRVA